MSLTFEQSFDQSFEQLPEELLIIIVYFLSANSIGNFRAVCKKFNWVVVTGSLHLKQLSPYTLRNFYFNAFNSGSITSAKKALLENSYQVTGIKSFSSNTSKIISWLTTLDLSPFMIDKIFLVVCRLSDLESVEWIVTHFDVNHLCEISIRIAICIKSLTLIKLLFKNLKFRNDKIFGYRIFDIHNANFMSATDHLYLDYPSYNNDPLIISWLIGYYNFTPDNIADSCIIHDACKYGYISVIMWLSEHKFLDTIDLQTNIYAACMYGHLEIVKILVQKFHKRRDIDVINSWLNAIYPGNMHSTNVYVAGSIYVKHRESVRTQPQIFHNVVAKWLIIHYKIVKEELPSWSALRLCDGDNIDMFEFISRQFYTREDILEFNLTCQLFYAHNYKILQWIVKTYNITRDESNLTIENVLRGHALRDHKLYEAHDNALIDLFKISKSDVIRDVGIDKILLHFNTDNVIMLLNRFELLDEKTIVRATTIGCALPLFKLIINGSNIQKSDFLANCYQCFVKPQSNKYKIEYLIQQFNITEDELNVIELKLQCRNCKS